MDPITLVIVGSALVTGIVAWKALSGPKAPVTPTYATQGYVSPYQSSLGAPMPGSVNPGGTGLQLASGSVQGAANVGSSVLATSGALSGVALGTATAGIAAVAGIGVALFAAHEQRKHQAMDENSAVNGAVAQVDQVLQTVFKALNAHQITVQDAFTWLGQAWTMYWQIIGNHIQPGRNGCQNGSNVPNFAGRGVGSIDNNTYYGCSSSKADWGAACCVSSTIKASLANASWGLQNPGKPFDVYRLYPSSYGFSGRAGYTLVYTG